MGTRVAVAVAVGDGVKEGDAVAEGVKVSVGRGAMLLEEQA